MEAVKMCLISKFWKLKIPESIDLSIKKVYFKQTKHIFTSELSGRHIFQIIVRTLHVFNLIEHARALIRFWYVGKDRRDFVSFCFVLFFFNSLPFFYLNVFHTMYFAHLFPFPNSKETVSSRLTRTDALRQHTSKTKSQHGEREVATRFYPYPG